MAYILGFTCADGNVYGPTLSWDLTNKHSSNLKLLKSFNQVMSSNYPIKKRENSYRLRISNKKILTDIKKLGVIPNKKKILKFPPVQTIFLRDFIRGFLDGDGWIIAQTKRRSKEISVGFVNGSLHFMKELKIKLNENVKISHFNLRKRIKITKRGIRAICYQLDFYSNNAMNVIKFLYDDLKKNDLLLERKYQKQLKARKYHEETILKRKVPKKVRNVEKKFNTSMKILLETRLYSKRILPQKIAKEFNVSISTIYRWLNNANVRKLSKRGSEEWKKRVFNRKQY
ncbi:hypothetical protein HZA97_06760 [Candidatus Woesearchaeota archaeon]|nr:hypothetical protein [Candidatus Woesearchaeota archaeon]